MRAFRYSAPKSVDEAVGLLAESASEPRVLAGGTDLLIQLRAGTRRSGHLVDVKRIPELDALACDARDGLRIGAAVPCYRVAEHPGVRALFPGLVEAAALIGSTQIQSRATLAGNLCNSSPAADTTPALMAIGARCVIAGKGGRREVPVEGFITAPGENVLAPGELLVALVAPAPPAGTSDAYQRLIPRSEMDIAVVGVGAQVTLEGERCTAARIALGAVGPTPLRADAAAACLVGRSIDAAALREAGEAARAAARPISDMRAPADYRLEIAAVLTRRVVAAAAERARAAARRSKP